jgi:hypothetical protein
MRDRRDDWDSTREEIEDLEKLKDLKRRVSKEYQTVSGKVSSGPWEFFPCVRRTI